MTKSRYIGAGAVMVTAGWVGLGAMTAVAEAPVEAVPLGEMVVSANRYASPASEVGSTVRVLNETEIARLKKTTVLELLRTMPGLEVVQGGGAGRTASVFIRGANSTQTLVLLDGVRVNPATGGQYDFSNLTADNIERIEVLSGPQSTLYGSEAMGGVILIVTKRGGTDAASSVQVEGGSYNSFKAGAALRGGEGRWDYSLSGSYEETDGISVVSGSAGAREDDGYENVSSVNRIGTALGDDGRADLTFRYLRGKTDLDGFTFGVGPTDDLNATQETESIVAALRVTKPVTDRLTPSLRVGISDENLEGSDPDDAFNNYDIDSRTLDLGLQADLTVCEGSILTAGYEFEERAGKNAGQFDETIDIHSVFVQEQLSWNDLVFGTLGVRLDDHSEFGDEVTYRGTVSARVPETALRFHGSVGTGFNAPTLNDLFFPDFGNPDLEAEESIGFDAGIEFGVGPAVVDVTYFQNEFDELIAFDAVTFTVVNVAESEVRGVEATVAVPVCAQVDLRGSYTYTDSEDKATGDALPRRPTHRATVTLAYRMAERLSGAVTLVAVNDRIDSDGSSMDDYERVDATLEYEVRDGIVPYIRIENALDQDYEEINGFSSPRLVAVGGIKVAM